MNGRPLSTRKKLQFLGLMMILAWATQTLLHQWARGADVGTNVPMSLRSETPAASAPAEKFVPAATGGVYGSATLELRAEATVYGAEVRLKQVCRWSDAQAAAFLPVADLVVLRLDGATPFRSVSMDELKTTLADAKANLALIRFTGPTLCTVRRSDVAVDPKDGLQQWIDARQGNTAEPRKEAPAPQVPPEKPAAATPAQANPATSSPAPALASSRQAAPAPVAAAPPDAPAVRSLRQALTEDLALRLNVPADRLQIQFNPKDERVLALSEPQFRFNLEATRARNLGDVAYDVLLVHGDTGSGELPATQKVAIAAFARAWETQVVAVKPITGRQVIRADDVTEQRTLADRLSDEPLLTVAQVVNQQAARDLKPGTPFTARLVEAVPLAKTGQFVTVTFNQGGVRIKTVGRAMETGSFGQTIKVRNETTNDTYEVILSGPQEGTVGAPAVPSPSPLYAGARAG